MSIQNSTSMNQFMVEIKQINNLEPWAYWDHMLVTEERVDKLITQNTDLIKASLPNKNLQEALEKLSRRIENEESFSKNAKSIVQKINILLPSNFSQDLNECIFPNEIMFEIFMQSLFPLKLSKNNPINKLILISNKWTEKFSEIKEKSHLYAYEKMLKFMPPQLHLMNEFKNRELIWKEINAINVKEGCTLLEKAISLNYLSYAIQLVNTGVQIKVRCDLNLKRDFLVKIFSEMNELSCVCKKGAIEILDKMYDKKEFQYGIDKIQKIDSKLVKELMDEEKCDLALMLIPKCHKFTYMMKVGYGSKLLSPEQLNVFVQLVEHIAKLKNKSPLSIAWKPQMNDEVLIELFNRGSALPKKDNLFCKSMENGQYKFAVKLLDDEKELNLFMSEYCQNGIIFYDNAEQLEPFSLFADEVYNDFFYLLAEKLLATSIDFQWDHLLEILIGILISSEEKKKYESVIIKILDRQVVIAGQKLQHF